VEETAFLVVESGAPYKSGHQIPLSRSENHLGRPTEADIPDIAFDNGTISRKHATISFRNSGFFLCDLPSSRHGVRLNGQLLEKNTPYPLKNNDRISLSNGAVILRFCDREDLGKTQELPNDITDRASPDSTGEKLVVDANRREVLLEGRELTPRITGYQFELLVLLYQKRGQAVSHREIVEWVWRDLANRDTIMPQNVATLIHRLRECLGEYGKLIVNIQAFGYRMEKEKS
jgi:pSer/pThr/pTyr-binding forkhead associated (FHA) protein